MAGPYRFSPFVDHDAGEATLPLGDPRMREDFVRQHVVRGWSRDAAYERYERWCRGELEERPVIPQR